MDSLQGMLVGAGIFFLVIFVVNALIGWKIFEKAGQPGWASLVPVYNQWILVSEICKKEPLWFVLFIIPCTLPVAAWVICMELAKKFGKSDMFGIGLFFFTPIFAAMLAFGDAEYEGSSLDDFDDEPRPRKIKPRYQDDDEDDLPPPRPKARKPRRDDDD